MDFYKILQRIMTDRDLSIPEVSRKTGISDSTIRSIISRKTKNISLEVAFKLSEGLGVSLEELNGEELDLVSNNNSNVLEDNTDLREVKLINHFRNLNDLGKNKAIDNLQDLTQISKYTINDNEVKETEETVKQIIKNTKKFNLKEELGKLDPIETIAAHNDHWDEPGEQEKMRMDIEMIKKLKNSNKQ